MIGTALRMAGQRLLPIVAPLGKKALAREAIKTGAMNAALEQGISLALTGSPAPLGQTLMRSAAIGALGGPVERGVLAGAKYLYPGLSGMEGRLASGLTNIGLKEGAANRLAGLAAGTGKLGLGLAGGTAIVEPATQAITNAIIPEQPRNVYGDMPVANEEFMPMPQPTPPIIQPNWEGMSEADLAHQRQLELIYARNYKFPSTIHHVSSSDQMGDPFAMAMQMVNVPTTKYL